MDMPDPVLLIDAGRALEREGALEQALEHFRAASTADDPALAAEALRRMADVHRGRSEWDAAIDAARRAQRLARASGLHDALADAQIAEGNALMCRGDFDAAIPIFVDVMRRTHAPRVRGIALQNLGSMLAQQGQLDEAERAFAQSSECFEQIGYRRGMAIALNNQARAAIDRGAPQAAIETLAQALPLAQTVGDAELMALVQLNEAEASGTLGDHERAEALASAALGHFVQSGNRWRQVECLRLLGSLRADRGDQQGARACLDRGLALATKIGTPREAERIAERLRALPDAQLAPSPRPTNQRPLEALPSAPPAPASASAPTPIAPTPEEAAMPSMADAADAIDPGTAQQLSELAATEESSSGAGREHAGEDGLTA